MHQARYQVLRVWRKLQHLVGWWADLAFFQSFFLLHQPHLKITEEVRVRDVQFCFQLIK